MTTTVPTYIRNLAIEIKELEQTLQDTAITGKKTGTTSGASAESFSLAELQKQIDLKKERLLIACRQEGVVL